MLLVLETCLKIAASDDFWAKIFAWEELVLHKLMRGVNCSSTFMSLSTDSTSCQSVRRTEIQEAECNSASCRIDRCDRKMTKSFWVRSKNETGTVYLNERKRMVGDRQSHVDLTPILRNRIDRLSSVIACKSEWADEAHVWTCWAIWRKRSSRAGTLDT